MRLEFKAVKPPTEDKLPTTMVFIDYESLYISFTKQYSMPPPLTEIINEIRTVGKITSIKVFGDFTKPELSQERNRVRTITSDIIDCGNESGVLKKDFTDFIMLDHVYQEVIKNSRIKQFIFITGDGHFSSAATFMRSYMDKTVGVYGVLGSLSRHLTDCASWAKVIKAVDEDELVYQHNLIRNLKSAETRGLLPTFMKTCEHTVRNFGGDQFRYENVLRQMIEDGYINTVIIESLENRQMRMLQVNWEKVDADPRFKTELKAAR